MTILKQVKMLFVLGIEGTAHTLGAGVVDEGGKVLSNVRDMYRPEHGGIHPREAANHHSSVLHEVISASLTEAGILSSDLSLVAFSQGPGLGPCLRSTATAARALALWLDIPLVGVNHCVSHLEIGKTVGAADPILLYASGANTQVIAKAHGRYRVFGETQDIGVGNMLDKFGRELGMPFPAGPLIERYALGSDEYVELPYSVKGMDMAFSGVLNAALSKKGKFSVETLCNSLQETVFGMLTEVTERAMAHTEKTEVLLGGGVAMNKRLQEMARIMAEERDAAFFVPPGGLLVDNGAMIAFTGLEMFKAGITTPVSESLINQNFRTDDVEVLW